MKIKKNKGGRPKKNINERQVVALAQIQCSYAEMAAVLGCDEKTLSNRFSQAIKEGREKGLSSLKRAQYKKAMDGNPTMLIWLGKQYLDQKDKAELDSNVIITHEHFFHNVIRKSLERKFNRLESPNDGSRR